MRELHLGCYNWWRRRARACAGDALLRMLALDNERVRLSDSGGTGHPARRGARRLLIPIRLRQRCRERVDAREQGHVHEVWAVSCPLSPHSCGVSRPVIGARALCSAPSGT